MLVPCSSLFIKLHHHATDMSTGEKLSISGAVNLEPEQGLGLLFVQVGHQPQAFHIQQFDLFLVQLMRCRYL